MVEAYGEVTLSPAHYDRGGHAQCQRGDLDNQPEDCRWFAADAYGPAFRWSDAGKGGAEKVAGAQARRRELLASLEPGMQDAELSESYMAVLAKARVIAPAAQGTAA